MEENGCRISTVVKTAPEVAKLRAGRHNTDNILLLKPNSAAGIMPQLPLRMKALIRDALKKQYGEGQTVLTRGYWWDAPAHPLYPPIVMGNGVSHQCPQGSHSAVEFMLTCNISMTHIIPKANAVGARDACCSVPHAPR